MISLLEVANRAYSGPRMSEKEWDLCLFRTMQGLVKEYNLAYSGPDQFFDVEDSYVDAAFRAAVHFLVDMGTYCISTHRVIQFTEDEVVDAVKAAPSEFVVGTGRDARVITKRNIEDSKRVNVISGGHCPWPIDLAPIAQAAYARVQRGDMIEGFNFTQIDGHEVHGLPIAVYAARRELALMREAVRMAGRPGLAITLYPILTKAGPLLAPIDPDTGLRRTDGLLLSILPDMKVEADYIAAAIAYEGYGSYKVNGGCFSIIGGFCGGVEGAMIETIAKAITAWIVYRDVFQYGCSVPPLSLTPQWTPAMEDEQRRTSRRIVPIWPTYVVNRALARHTNIIRFGGFGGGAGVGGMGSETEFLMIAKNVIMSTVLGVNLTCTGGGANPTPYHVEYRAMVSDATVKAGVKKREVPGLIKRIENTVKKELHGKSINGYGDRRMLAYKDFERYFKPMKESYDFYDQTPSNKLVESAKKAAKHLGDLGIDLEAAAIH